MADPTLEQVIDVQDGAAVPAPVVAPVVGPDPYDLILGRIEDPNCPVADVSRLISVEIAKANRDLSKCFNDPTLAWKSKAYTDQIKALRELSKQLTETDVLSKKDVLNMDGPKFVWAVHELAKLYKQALKEAGCEPSLIENAMQHYADLVSVNTERLKRDVEKITSSTV